MRTNRYYQDFRRKNCVNALRYPEAFRCLWAANSSKVSPFGAFSKIRMVASKVRLGFFLLIVENMDSVRRFSGEGGPKPVRSWAIKNI